MLGDGAVGLNALGLEGGQEPVAGHAGVGEGLQGGEGLGGDDEQGRLRVEVRDLLGAVGGIDVGDEAALKALLHVGLESLVDHDGTEVGAADADIDHRLDGLAGDTGPLPRAHAAGEGVDLLQDLVDVGDDVLAVHAQGVGGRATQGGVEDGTVLGDVDVLTGVHGVTAARDVDLLGELGQGVADVVGQQVLGQVDVEVPQLVGEALGALGIVGEPGAQVRGHGVVELGKALPGGRGGGVNRIQHGYSLWVLRPRATVRCQTFSRSRRPAGS